MAQALFQKIKNELAEELSYQSASAGISAVEGDLPTRETVLCLSKFGIDVSTHRARKIDHKMIKDSSLILTMTRKQQEYLKKNYPQAEDKIFLLRPFCHQNSIIKNSEVEDPYGRDLYFYEDIYHQISDDIEKLILYLRKVDQDE